MIEKIKLYKGKVIIWFEERDWNGKKVHSYYHDFKGMPDKKKKIISVTQVTGLIDKSKPLQWWATKMMGLYIMQNFDAKKIKTMIDLRAFLDVAQSHYKEALAEAADIGTDAHEWVSKRIQGLKPKQPEDDRVRSCVTAFMDFESQMKPRWIHTERIVYSRKYDFIGRLDAIAKVDKMRELVDFKTANGLYPDVVIQTAGYQIAYEEETGEVIDRRRTIRFGKEDAKFEQKVFTENKIDKEIFLHLLPSKRRIKELEYGSKKV